MRQAASHKVGGYRRLAGRESRIRIIGPAKEEPIKSIRWRLWLSSPTPPARAATSRSPRPATISSSSPTTPPRAGPTCSYTRSRLPPMRCRSRQASRCCAPLCSAPDCCGNGAHVRASPDSAARTGGPASRRRPSPGGGRSAARARAPVASGVREVRIGLAAGGRGIRTSVSLGSNLRVGARPKPCRWFALDAPVEQAGFEPSVPRNTERTSAAASDLQEETRRHRINQDE